jgi:hypothetical protein
LRVRSDKVFIGTADAKYNEIDWTGSNFASAGLTLEKVSITAGKFIGAGVTFARGIKDTPIILSRAGPYEQEMDDAARKMYVVLYDMRDQRGWLLDGASALLHITCTQLSSRPYCNSKLFDCQRFEYADPTKGPDAAYRVLTNQSNRELSIFEEVETWAESSVATGQAGARESSLEELKKKTKRWCFQDLVRQTYHILELIQDYQSTMSISPGKNLGFTDRRRLEGFGFMDIVDGTHDLLPRVAILKSSGRGWMDFTKSIRAITLLGKGFGELIKPAQDSNKLCKNWLQVPTKKDYLAVCISILHEICKRHGDRKTEPVELANGIFWHKPDKLYEHCKCTGERSAQCERVQELLSRTSKPKTGCNPFDAVRGAVIFGERKRFYHSRPNFGAPFQVDESDYDTEDENITYDSGLGPSIISTSGNAGTNSTGNSTMFSSNTGCFDGHTLRTPITAENLPSGGDAIVTEGLTLRNTANLSAGEFTDISAQGAVEPGVLERITPKMTSSRAGKRKWDIFKRAATVRPSKQHREDSGPATPASRAVPLQGTLQPVFGQPTSISVKYALDSSSEGPGAPDSAR